jgi:NAD(P)H-hydrate epimerase
MAGLSGDAAHMAGLWTGPVEALEPGVLTAADVILDALFGAGLARPVEGAAAAVVQAVQSAKTPVVAVDVPSGVHGDSGQVLGLAASADLTVTFHRPKTGHLLLPGQALCGERVVIDIGIPPTALDAPDAVHENDPDLWLSSLPRPRIDGHKYDRGHAVVASGDAFCCGASRLAARAALRAGSGLVSAVGPADAMTLHAAYTAAVLTEVCETAEAFDSLLGQCRRNAVLLGPGNGVSDLTRANVGAALRRKLPCVLDADALTAFEERPAALFAAIDGPCVLTPHDGEFARLFGPLAGEANKLVRARQAAAQSGAVVVLKGGDTVVAAPDGRAVITTNAPPTMASAGSGDILAGIVVGLLAQGAAPFEAACAGVWMHGEAGHEAGLGLIADDLPEALPPVLQRLY